MTGALAEALVAAQRRAMQAVERAYVAGELDRDAAEKELILVGATDRWNRAALLDALDTLRKYGVPVPAEPKPAPTENGEPKPASQRQRDYIDSLMDKGGHIRLARPDLEALTSEKASELIAELKSGAYDASKWDVPF